jgi:hypothetical protein
MSVKSKILSFLTKKPGNTLTVKQAQSRFKAKNIYARIGELRDDGHPIVTNVRKSGGRSFAVYSYQKKTSKSKRAFA